MGVFMKTPCLDTILALLILLPLPGMLFQLIKRRSDGEDPQGRHNEGPARQALNNPIQRREHRDGLQGRPSKNPMIRSTADKRGEMRRGIILMTVLGPCRAFDPPD